jgi:hypothetical protein
MSFGLLPGFKPLAACMAGALLTAMTVGLSIGASAEQAPSRPRFFGNGFPRDAQFFPIGVWLQNPRNAAAYRAMGVNTYVGLWNAPTEEDLARLQEHGLHAIVEQTPQARALPNAHVIRAWLHGDEPDNAQSDGRGGYGDCILPAEVVRRYKALRNADPTRPVFLNFGQAVANPLWFGRGVKCSQISPEAYYSASSPGADIVSFDIYPVAEERQHHVMGRLELVGEGVTNLRRWSKSNQAVWNAIETTHIKHPSRRPTPQEVRSEVWMSLIHGSTGIFYFVHEWKPSFREDAVFRYPEVVAEITRLNAQITALAPVLNSPTLVDKVRVNAAVAIATMTKQYAGDTYVFAVGMERQPASVRLTLSGIAGGRAVVIGEDRTVRIEGGVIADDFGVYGVRLYKIPGG